MTFAVDPVRFVESCLRQRLAEKTATEPAGGGRALTEAYAQAFDVHGSWRVPRLKDSFLQRLFFALRHPRADASAHCRGAVHTALDRGIPFVLAAADGSPFAGRARAGERDLVRQRSRMRFATCSWQNTAYRVARLDTRFNLAEPLLLVCHGRLPSGTLALIWGCWAFTSGAPGTTRVWAEAGPFEALLHGRRPLGTLVASQPVAELYLPRKHWHWLPGVS